MTEYDFRQYRKARRLIAKYQSELKARRSQHARNYCFTLDLKYPENTFEKKLLISSARTAFEFVRDFRDTKLNRQNHWNQLADKLANWAAKVQEETGHCIVKHDSQSFVLERKRERVNSPKVKIKVNWAQWKHVRKVLGVFMHRGEIFTNAKPIKTDCNYQVYKLHGYTEKFEPFTRRFACRSVDGQLFVDGRLKELIKQVENHAVRIAEDRLN